MYICDRGKYIYFIVKVYIMPCKNTYFLATIHVMFYSSHLTFFICSFFCQILMEIEFRHKFNSENELEIFINYIRLPA